MTTHRRSRRRATERSAERDRVHAALATLVDEGLLDPVEESDGSTSYAITRKGADFVHDATAIDAAVNPHELLGDRCDDCMIGRHTDCSDVEDGSCCCPPGPDRHYFAEDDDA